MTKPDTHHPLMEPIHPMGEGGWLAWLGLLLLR
jgi:hypothetical protein